MSKVTSDEARALLSYDPESGVLSWKARARDRFSSEQRFKAWNTRYAGKPSGCVSSGTGYLVMSIHNRRELVHRVIWLIVTGQWPDCQIDHQDHQRTNNRWSNLRAVTHEQNGRNQSARRARPDAVFGVSKRRDTGKWSARIRINGKTKHLGCFDTPEQARAVRKSAELAADFHPMHGIAS